MRIQHQHIRDVARGIYFLGLGHYILCLVFRKFAILLGTRGYFDLENASLLLLDCLAEDASHIDHSLVKNCLLLVFGVEEGV